MILKNSFLTSIFENFKRRTWLFALSSLFFFFYFPVFVLVYAQHINSYAEYDSPMIYERFQTFMMELTSFSPMSLMIVTVAAFICATQGYSYLHNRKKIDFYHCLPVTQTKRFFTIYLNGFLAFFLPYLLGLSLALIVFAFTPQVMTTALLWNAVYGLIFNMLSFLAIYNLALIAVTLTGRGVMAFLGVCVFMLYEFMVKGLLYIFASQFFQTYSPFNEPYLKNVTSPILYIATKLDSFNFNLFTLPQNWSVMTSMIPMILFYILVYGAIGYFLYCKRPSEGGGKAIAFQAAKPIIKVFLVVPCSLFTAILLKDLTNGNYIFMLFGMIIGLLLSHCLLEVIFEFDLRAAFHHRKQLLLSLGIVAIIYSVFEFDLIRFDNYLPDMTQVDNAAVMVRGDNSYNYYELLEEEDDFNRIDWMDYQSERMQLTDLALVEELVTSSIEFTNGDYYTVENSIHFNVNYRLKNGKQKNRSYTIDLDKNAALIDRLYTMEEFKTSIYQLYDDALFSPDTMKNYSTISSNGFQNFTVSAEQAGELLELYKKELLNLTCSEEYSEVPIGLLNFTKSYQNNYLGWDYPVYPSFTGTIQYLKDHQLYESPTLDPETILSIELTNYNYDIKTDTPTEDRTITKVYTNAEEIAQITNAIYPSSLIYLANMNYDIIYHDELSVKVNFKNNAPAYFMDYYDDGYGNLNLLRKETPQFVLTDTTYKD